MSETQTSSFGMSSTAMDGVIPTLWPAVPILRSGDHLCSAGDNKPSSKGFWWVAHLGHKVLLQPPSR